MHQKNNICMVCRYSLTRLTLFYINDACTTDAEVLANAYTHFAQLVLAALSHCHGYGFLQEVCTSRLIFHKVFTWKLFF